VTHTPSTPVLDLRGLRCPLPVLRTRKAMAGLQPGAELVVLSDDPLAALDIPNFIRESGGRTIAAEQLGRAWRFVLAKGAR
jgi:tRNA 2-thiouridine synthesizing protein A